MGSDKRETAKSNHLAGDSVLPLAEEELRVSKQEVVTGRVRVRAVTDKMDELVRQELQGERVDVERVPVDNLLEPGATVPQVRTEGAVTILPIVEEVLVVEKRLLVKEELRITRRSTTEVAEIPVTLRKQRAIIERLDRDGDPIP